MSNINRIIQCPVCASSVDPVAVVSINESAKKSYLEYSKKKYNSLIDDWLELLHLAIDHCTECGHYWYREQPDQAMLNTMYESGQPLHSTDKKQDRSVSPDMIVEMSRLMRLVKNSDARFLDYGSGFGRWARAATTVGFKVTAYEPSEERGVEDSDVDFTLVHDVDDLRHHLFDAVNLEQVLEHVANPVEVLIGLRGYCAPNAVVRITVPNVLRCPEGVKIWSEWPFNGERAHTMAPFEHLHGFTPASLRAAVYKAGFVPVSNLRTWLLYPREMIRGVVGKLFPQLGQTFVLIKVKKN